MRGFGLSWLLLFTAMAPLQASCRYFRTHAKAEHCKELPHDAVTEPDALLRDTPEGPAIQLVCECDYTLQGSAALSPQCDLEHTDEPTFVTPSSNVAAPCSVGRRLCEELCPKDAEN